MLLDVHHRIPGGPVLLLQLDQGEGGQLELLLGGQLLQFRGELRGRLAGLLAHEVDEDLGLGHFIAFVTGLLT